MCSITNIKCEEFVFLSHLSEISRLRWTVKFYLLLRRRSQRWCRAGFVSSSRYGTSSRVILVTDKANECTRDSIKASVIMFVTIKRFIAIKWPSIIKVFDTSCRVGTCCGCKLDLLFSPLLFAFDFILSMMMKSWSFVSFFRWCLLWMSRRCYYSCST